MTLRQAAFSMPAIAGITPPKTFAAWPVWSGSKRGEAAFQPLPKRAAVQLWHKARRFERSSKLGGKHGGALGHAGLQVLYVLIFDFLNFNSGRLDPAYETIAKRANLARSTVAAALRRLKHLGIIAWIQRCKWSADGRLAQETNAYAVLPSSSWHGYREEAPPPPQGSAWGKVEGNRHAMAQAAEDVRHGLSDAALVQTLASDSNDPLAAALARLGGSILGRVS